MAAYAAVVIGRGVLRRGSHLIIVEGCGEFRKNRVGAIAPPPPPVDKTNLI